MITNTVVGKPTKLYYCRTCGARAVAGPDDPPALWISLRTFRHGQRRLLGSFCSRQCVVDFLRDQNFLASRPA